MAGRPALLAGTLVAIALLAVLPAWSLGSSAPAVRTIEITIHYSRFAPDRVAVQPGETVRFVIRNSDPIDHEFILGDRAVQLVHERGTEAHHGARPGEISIPAGTTRSTTYTFDGPGSLIFGCHMPGHYAYGTRGAVLVV